MFICITTLAVFLGIQPWQYLSLDLFIYVQFVSLALVVLLKTVQFCCCWSDHNMFLNCFAFALMAVFLQATACGWLHPDLSFDTIWVEVPVNKDELDYNRFPSIPEIRAGNSSSENTTDPEAEEQET